MKNGKKKTTKTKATKAKKIELRVSVNEPWWRGYAAGCDKSWRDVRKSIRKEATEAVDESGAEVVVSFVEGLSAKQPYDIMFLAPGTDEEASADDAKEYGIRKPGGVCRRVGATLRDLKHRTF